MGRMDTEEDEFSFLVDCAEDAGLAWDGRPQVARRHVDVGDRKMSAIVWGDSPAKIVLLHGGAQNAHTWDTLALALRMPLVAVDLPGHGHSDWRSDHDYGVSAMADDVAAVVRQTAPESSILVGIGLGARWRCSRPIACHRWSSAWSWWTRPPVQGCRTDARAPSEAGANVAAFTAERHFASFEEALERAVAYNPGRSARSLRRGVIHNAREMPDGSWEWRWDPRQRDDRDYAPEAVEEALVRFAGPVLLVRGGRSDIVSDELVAAFKGRHTSTRLITIEGAAHAVQGSHPVALAEAIRSFWQRHGSRRSLIFRRDLAAGWPRPPGRSRPCRRRSVGRLCVRCASPTLRGTPDP
jgi:pimeloyl-ACP methyl ester carboxylesterase